MRVPKINLGKIKHSKLALRAHNSRPEIAFVVGVGCIAIGGYLTIKGTIKAVEDLKEHEENIESWRFRPLATMGRRAQESGKAVQYACPTIQLSNW